MRPTLLVRVVPANDGGSQHPKTMCPGRTATVEAPSLVGTDGRRIVRATAVGTEAAASMLSAHSTVAVHTLWPRICSAPALARTIRQTRIPQR